jgi:hypothetical protein
MTTITVYGYAVNDQGKMIQPPSKRTAASIAEIGATILLHTAQEVDTSALRPDGRYLPKSQKSGGPIAAEDGLAATLTLDTQQAASSRRSR